MRAHAAKLVNARLPANDGPILHLHMPRQPHVVGQNGVAAQLHVMCNVHAGHDPVVIAHARAACILHGAGVEGAKLANGVAVTNFQARRLARVFLVLRRPANGVVREDAVVFANGGMAVDHAMRADDGARAYAHMGANHAKSANGGICSHVGGRVDQGCWVNLRHGICPCNCSFASVFDFAHGAHQISLAGQFAIY